MKVLIVGVNYAPEPTGIAPYTTAMCAGLVAQGHRVRVITTMPHYPEWRVRDGYSQWSSRESIDGVVVQRVRHYVPSRPSGIRRLLSELSFGIRASLTRWGRPDAVVFVSPALFASAIGMLRTRLQGFPAIVWLQDLYSLGIVETAGQSSAGLVARLVTAVESRVLSAAAGVCVIHERFAVVAHELGADPTTIAVVRNWTHVAHLPVSDVRATRERLQWSQSNIVALHSGAMGRKQDLDNVVAAGRLAEERHLPVRFVLMGNGSERSRLEESAAGIGTVTFVDPVSEDFYPSALAAANSLIVNEHAGLRETAVPSKLTSYFASGRPIVAATDPGSVTAAEIEASSAGVAVPPANPDALLEAVLALHADPERATELGRRGLEYRRSVLSSDVAIRRFSDWLAALIGR